jgi:hypothetical protein
MNTWEYILNRALLGTDKPAQGQPDLPEVLHEIFARIEKLDGAEKEAKFLHQAALVYNYRKSGLQPLQKKDASVLEAATETRPYCSAKALALLRDVLDQDSPSLLGLWMEQCVAREVLIDPELIPVILDRLRQHPDLKTLAQACIGNRGLWLSGLNPDWEDFNQPVLSEEEVWSAGKHQERVELLKKIRQTDPEKARTLLIQTWPAENAAQRLDFLQTLRLNLNEDDLPVLESMLTEKGQKIRDEILYQIKSIPGSRIVRQYETVLETAVILKKEKAMLGIMTRTNLKMELPDGLPDELFKTGIDKLAGPKSIFNDQEYIIYQLISSVPPAFWERQFQTTPGEIFALFEKQAGKFISALGLAVSQFKQPHWISYFLDQPGFYQDFLPMMKPEEQEKYWLKFLDKDHHLILRYAVSRKEEWSTGFSIKAFRYLAGDPYTYNRQFYNQHNHLIPVAMLTNLDGYTAQESTMGAAWERNKTHLITLLQLKQQIKQAFNHKTV